MAQVEILDSSGEQLKAEYSLREFGRVICGCWFGITPLGEFKFDPNFARITYDLLSKQDKDIFTLENFTSEMRSFKQFNDWHLGEKLKVDSVKLIDAVHATADVAFCRFYSERSNGLPYLPPLYSPGRMSLNLENNNWKVVFTKTEPREFTYLEKQEYGLIN